MIDFTSAIDSKTLCIIIEHRMINTGMDPLTNARSRWLRQDGWAVETACQGFNLDATRRNIINTESSGAMVRTRLQRLQMLGLEMGQLSTADVIQVWALNLNLIVSFGVGGRVDIIRAPIRLESWGGIASGAELHFI